MLKNLSQNITIISIASLIISYFDLYTYYGHFELNIAPYVDLSEIIFSFTWLYGWLIQFILIFSSYAFIEWLRSQGERKALGKVNALTSKELYLSLIVIWIIVISGSCTLVYFLRQRALKDIEDNDFLFYAIIIFGLFFLAWSGFNIIKRERAKAQSIEFGTAGIDSPWSLVLIGVVIFGLIMTRNEIRAKNIIDGHARYSLKATTNESIYQTNDSILYIGSTQRYVFLFNIRSKRTIALPEREIKELIIKKLRTTL